MSTETPSTKSSIGEPAWEVARFFPLQGQWLEEDFFRIHTNQMAELADGRLEILPMPTWLHQLIVDFLLTAIKHHTSTGCGGVTLFAPLPVRLFAGTIREPDILFVLPQNLPKDLNGYPSKLDLVMEVVSAGEESRKRDYEDKRLDYAKAGIAEYWIVDHDQARITVMTLEKDIYRVASENGPGQTACSLLLTGLEICVDEMLALGKP